MILSFRVSAEADTWACAPEAIGVAKIATDSSKAALKAEGLIMSDSFSVLKGEREERGAFGWNTTRLRPRSECAG